MLTIEEIDHERRAHTQHPADAGGIQKEAAGGGASTLERHLIEQGIL
jgi:hypothetical protein